MAEQGNGRCEYPECTVADGREHWHTESGYPLTLVKRMRVVCRGGGGAELWLDDEPFGYCTVDGFTAARVGGRPPELPAVTVTIPAMALEVVHDFVAEPPSEPLPEDTARVEVEVTPVMVAEAAEPVRWSPTAFTATP